MVIIIWFLGQKTAVGMYSSEREYVEFDKECDCSGQVEVWLNRVMDSMRAAIRWDFLGLISDRKELGVDANCRAHSCPKFKKIAKITQTNCTRMSKQTLCKHQFLYQYLNYKMHIIVFWEINIGLWCLQVFNFYSECTFVMLL